MCIVHISNVTICNFWAFMYIINNTSWESVPMHSNSVQLALQHLYVPTL